MAIFHPDNDSRKQRLVELTSDAQNYLKDAKAAYQQFTSLNSQINAKLSDLYKRAGLGAPSTTSAEILKDAKAVGAAGVAATTVDVSDLVLKIGGVAVTGYFAPAATATLVDVGIISEETAATALLGTGVTIGTLGGAIGVGIIVGGIVVGIGAALDAYEGADLKVQLQQGIVKAFGARLSTRVSLDGSLGVVSALKSVNTALDSLSAELGAALTEDMIEKTIQQDATPAIQDLKNVGPNRAIAELRTLDGQRHSWTSEDPKS